MVVTRGADNLQPRVERDARDRPEVALKGPLQPRVLRLERLELHAEVRVRPIVLRPRRIPHLLALRRNSLHFLVVLRLSFASYCAICFESVSFLVAKRSR